MPSPELTLLSIGSDWVIVDKPAGLLVHPTELARSRDSVMGRLRDQLGRKVYPVHRLDRAASGALVVALSSEAASALSEQVRARAFHKRYAVVVRGWLAESGVIEKPLQKSPRHGPKAAHTEFRRLAIAELPFAIPPHASTRYSLAEVTIGTGRLHQIRKHLVHARHPVIGDTVYGDGKHNRLFREEFGISRLMLHCVEISFTNPGGGGSVRATAPWPDGFLQAFQRLGWHPPELS